MNKRLMAVLAIAGLMGFGAFVQAEDEAAADSAKCEQNAAKVKKGAKNPKQHQMMMSLLKENYSEQLKEIQELRKTDPEAAKEKMQALIKEAREKAAKEREEFRNLVKEYKETKSEEALNKLKAKIGENFDKIIAQKEKQLATMKAKLDELKAKKNEVIEKRIQNITSQEKRAKGDRPNKGKGARGKGGDKGDKALEW